MIYRTSSTRATEKLAPKILHGLGAKHVIAMDGNLGAGKTVLVKGIARVLGVREVVQSPTFILMNVFPVHRERFTQLVHVDCYRITHPDELVNIGLPDYLNDPSALVVIEWASRIRTLLRGKALWVTISVADHDTRRIDFKGVL
jgi:tRNA threonylcarbamoyladenosine biosynthesis protein TsaE